MRIILAALIIGVLPCGAALAGSDAPIPQSQDWKFSGPFGGYDKASMQRGYKVYREVCATCHSMKRVYFRNLKDLGYSEEEIKAIAAEYSVEDGPNDEGEMFDRAGLPSDAFPSPYSNDKAAAYANGGTMPPDLSLITKARANGANYVHVLINGYQEPPVDADIVQGKYWNKYFPGHNISMAPPLSDEQVSYEDGVPETVEQYAKDVVHFLVYASDPHMEERKSTGLRVIIFLSLFALIMYGVKKKKWKDVH